MIPSSIRTTRDGRRCRRALLAVALIATVGAWHGSARAQGKRTDAERAEALFQSAKARMKAGDYATACPTFAESYRLDPGIGTLLALALCHEQEGKTGSAYSEFRKVEIASVRERRSDRVALARERMAALAPVLSNLTIRRSRDLPSDAAVKLDGALVVVTPEGTKVPVDPGEHKIEASAPGHKPWEKQLTIPAGPHEAAIVVPPLEHDPRPAVAPAAREASGDGRRLAGLVVGGVGVVAIGVGGYFGVRAISKRHDATALCPTARCANAEGVSLNDDAKTSATVSTVAIGIGAAAVTLGVILVLTGGRHASSVRSATGRGGSGLVFE